MSRSCGTCTKCCEGVFAGNVRGKDFFPGRPCHFVSIGEGCTIYEDRPQMCRKFNCGWILNEDIPHWMKPEFSNCLIRRDNFPGTDIHYIELIETDIGKVGTRALSWFIEWGSQTFTNVRWRVNGEWSFIGEPPFVDYCYNIIRGDEP